MVAAALAAAACRSSGGSSFTGSAVLAPSSDAEAAHDELLGADLARSDSASRLGLGAGLASAFTDDAVYLRGGLPLLRGREAVRAVLVADRSLATVSVRWQPVRAEVSRDQRSGYTYGYAVLAAPQPSAPSIHIDRYIAF